MPRPLVPNRRERILDAAEQLVLDRGFDAMSVASVAECAGIAKGAVYREFASKYELREALLGRGAERMRVRVEQELGEQPLLSEGYRATIRALLGDPLMTAAYLDDEGVLGAHADAVSDERFRVHFEGTAEWIRQLQERGAFSSAVDAEQLALALSCATIGLLSAAKRLGPLSPAQLGGAISVLATMVAGFEQADAPAAGV